MTFKLYCGQKKSCHLELKIQNSALALVRNLTFDEFLSKNGKPRKIAPSGYTFAENLSRIDCNSKSKTLRTARAAKVLLLY